MLVADGRWQPRHDASGAHWRWVHVGGFACAWCAAEPGPCPAFARVDATPLGCDVCVECGWTLGAHRRRRGRLVGPCQAPGPVRGSVVPSGAGQTDGLATWTSRRTGAPIAQVWPVLQRTVETYGGADQVALLDLLARRAGLVAPGSPSR